MSLWIHEFTPYDHWAGWNLFDPPTDADLVANQEDPDRLAYLEYLRRLHNTATAQLPSIGWEGDGTWFVSGFIDPGTAGPGAALAVKQQNNGATYLIAPAKVAGALQAKQVA